MQIDKILLSSDAVLAPIAGFTDVGFRKLALEYGAGLTYTEMVSCKGMVYGNEKTAELLATTENEKPCVAQVFGCEPSIMARAIANKSFEKFDIIDINMGCPVPKIVKNGEGSALVNNPKLAMQIVKECRLASDKPISVKFRKGFAKGENVAVDFAKYMQDAGVCAIAVHGRTREQYYSGKADWDCIAKVVENVQIPVFANGDVNSLQDYIDIKQHTNAQGVMIARGALGNPQIFKEIAMYNGQVISKNVDIKKDIMEQIQTLQKFFCERYIYSNMKKHICYYAKGMPMSRNIKDKVCRVESVGELINCVNEFF